MLAVPQIDTAGKPRAAHAATVFTKDPVVSPPTSGKRKCENTEKEKVSYFWQLIDNLCAAGNVGPSTL